MQKLANKMLKAQQLIMKFTCFIVRNVFIFLYI